MYTVVDFLIQLHFLEWKNTIGGKVLVKWTRPSGYLVVLVSLNFHKFKQ